MSARQQLALPREWTDHFGERVVICTGRETARPWLRAIVGIHPCGTVEPIAWGCIWEQVEREAKRLASFVPGAVYAEARP